MKTKKEKLENALTLISNLINYMCGDMDETPDNLRGSVYSFRKAPKSDDYILTFDCGAKYRISQTEATSLTEY